MVLLISIFVLRWYLKHQNALKEIAMGPDQPDSNDEQDFGEGLADFTDQQQRSFQYVY
jgi:hypothetical protein